ncbi:MAG: PRC-barrel domain-containing protein [Chthoniobacterales bacterium]
MYNIRISFRIALHSFLLLIFNLIALNVHAQSKSGTWDETVGKKIINRQGETLGRVSDTAIDIEHARCVGLLVSSGGFLGIGSHTVLVPAGALTQGPDSRILYLDMSKEKFRNAPSFALSKGIGPPQASALAGLYQYYGLRPYFNTVITSSPVAGQTAEQLGYVQRGSAIFNLPVENLQGIRVGTVSGFRGLNSTSGHIKGVVIVPSQNGMGMSGENKIVQPQDLRYTQDHSALQMNNHEQAFRDSPRFTSFADGSYREDSPERPGTREAPLVQGNRPRDKAITARIQSDIQGNSELSNYAQNIEVGTVKGKTIIRGRVQTEKGRAAILAYAYQAAGRGNVTDQIQVLSMSHAEARIDR